MAKVRFISKVGQKSGSRSRGQNVGYQQKGLNTRNTPVQYESPISFGSKVIAKVIMLTLDRQTDRRMDRQGDSYIPPPILVCGGGGGGGYKKVKYFFDLPTLIFVQHVTLNRHIYFILA